MGNGCNSRLPLSCTLCGLEPRMVSVCSSAFLAQLSRQDREGATLVNVESAPHRFPVDFEQPGNFAVGQPTLAVGLLVKPFKRGPVVLAFSHSTLTPAHSAISTVMIVTTMFAIVTFSFPLSCFLYYGWIIIPCSKLLLTNRSFRDTISTNMRNETRRQAIVYYAC